MTSALLVTYTGSRPIAIIDIGPKAESQFRIGQVIEVQTSTRPTFELSGLCEAVPKNSPMPSQIHHFRATYIHGLGQTPLLSMCCLNVETEDLMVEYFGAFASGNHDALLGLKNRESIVSILGYLRQ